MEEYLFNVAEAADRVDGVVEVRPNVWWMGAEEVPPLVFVASQVARILRVDEATVRELVAQGELEGVEVAGEERILASSVVLYVESLRGGAW